MRGVGQFGHPKCNRSAFLRATLIVGLAAFTACLLVQPSAAQMHGPPATTTVGGHFLAPPPSVTSLAGRYLPPPLPSVTSIPNYGYTRRSYTPYYNGYYRGRGYGNGNGRGGVSYAIPYYIPSDGYGYDYVGGGPDLYSGPPIGPSEPILHIVVEQPDARYPSNGSELADAPPLEVQPSQQEQPTAREAKPNEPSVLIFRDGHQEEVSNYAIMGQTVYVFDKRTQKVALADLDVPATIKANDDRGLEFKIPAQKPAPKNSDLQQKSAPDQTTKAPSNIASLVP
jgi:hypothetical protein